MARPSTMAERALVLVLALCSNSAIAQNIDGGRSDLPGMKQDMFDQVNKAKRAGANSARMGKGPPDCPKSDHMTPFTNLAFVGTELFVRLDATEGTCQKIVSIGGANLSVLKNASLSCGPSGEWKKRIAEELSAVFFQAGAEYEWVKNENDTVEVITEEGNFTVVINEAKYAVMMDCWARGCGCEQASNPKMKLILFALLVVALGGLSYDSVKLAWEQFRGKKPDKHVMCKNGHRMGEVAPAPRHFCDMCRKAGTCYQCNVTCNYDLCKVCYKDAKKKTRAKWKEYLEKHPDDPDNKKKDKDDDDDEDKKDKSESEAGDKNDAKNQSEAESDAPAETNTPPTTGDEKAKSEEKDEDSDSPTK